MSQHLRVLKRARLVRDRWDGTRRIYELNPQGVGRLRDHFAHLWGQALAAFQKSNGAECNWGQVLVWSPPKLLVVYWQLQPDWQYSVDLSPASEVSFEFSGTARI